MGWPTTFAQLAGGNQPLSIFDVMFQQVAQMIAIPCTASGQNNITLSPIGQAPTLTAYTEFCGFRFKAVQTSNGLITANFLTTPSLPVYLGDGVTQAGAGITVLGQEYVLIFSQSLNSGSGGFFIERASIPAAVTAAGGAVSGLLIVNNTATPNTQLDCSMTEITLNNASGQSIRFTPSGIAFTVNLAVNGVNGLDTGSINLQQNYYIWGISDGGVLRGIASLSSTFAGLTFPGSFTFAKFLGAWRTAPAVAQLLGGRQAGRRFEYIPGASTPTTAMPIAGTGTANVASGSQGSITTPTYLSISLANQVPPNAASVDVVLNLPASSGPSQSIIVCNNFTGLFANGQVNSTTNPPALSIGGSQTTGAGVNNSNQFQIQGRFAGAGPLGYASNAGAGGAMFVRGYENNL
jgi:hypothetical protein